MHLLARDVVIVFTIKAALVIAAAIFLFGPAQRPNINTRDIETRLIGPPSSPSRIATP